MYIKISQKDQSYTALFELEIPGEMFSIKKLESIRGEMNNTLRKMAGSVQSQYLKAKGRKRYDLNEKMRRFHVLQGYVMSVSQVERENEELTERMKRCLKNSKSGKSSIRT